ncbi:MAG: rRNA maturation RNase YbeY [Cyanobacteria bacterium P01_D01_bin.105]
MALHVEVFVDGCAVSQVEDVAIAQYQSWMKVWLTALAPALSPIDAYEVSLRLTGDQEIQQLNTAYRQQAKPTDVLSFAALEANLPGAQTLYQVEPLPLGDIIISVETAARQASKGERSLAQEVAWLGAHGLLHLLGWDHPDEASLGRMLEEQTHLLSLIETV